MLLGFIGHVLLPQLPDGVAASPLQLVKKKRLEADAAMDRTALDASGADQVLCLAEWTAVALRTALRSCVAAALGELAASAGSSSSSTRQDTAWWGNILAEAVQLQGHPQWPIVRQRTGSPSLPRAGSGSGAAGPPPGKPATVSWQQMSFALLPFGALDVDEDGEDEEKGEGIKISAELKQVLRQIRLPRHLYISSLQAKVAVIYEPVTLPGTALPQRWSGGAASEAFCISAQLSVLRRRPLLLVGAGGIGCEILKVLVLRQFSCIHIIDLDTIDATNLNRQLLFQFADVGASKAETARRVVLQWKEGQASPHREMKLGCRDGAATGESPCPEPLDIVAYHDNVKAEVFDDAFFKQFAVVLNALDNVTARQHVNRRCMRNAIPLIESGTMGYNGQVQPILKQQFECYDCRAKPPDQKTYPVCTIHARPTSMVHCVHYAKELYEVLFGAQRRQQPEGEDSGAATATALPPVQGELSYLGSMVAAWQGGPVSSGADATAARIGSAELAAELMQLLFVKKVEELLAMKSSWPTAPPVALQTSAIHAVLEETIRSYRQIGKTCGIPEPPSRDAVLPVEGSIQLFLHSVGRCMERLNTSPLASGVAFQKEDNTAVDFVAAAANLRARVFHIEAQSVEAVRSIAGAIIPAIATTNAMIAAGVVHELESLLWRCYAGARRGEEEPDSTASERSSAGAPAIPTTSAATLAPTPHVVYARQRPQMRRRVVRWNAELPLSLDLYDGPLGQPEMVGVTATANGLPHSTPTCWRTIRVMDQYLLHSLEPAMPNTAGCTTCQDVVPEVVVRLDLTQVTLRQLVTDVLSTTLAMEGVSVSYGASIVYEEEDYEAMAAETLATVLQLPSSFDSGATAPSRQSCFIVNVDALNKEVAWSVALVHHAAPDARDDADAAACGRTVEKDKQLPFQVEGLEKALAAEMKALSRMAEEEQQQQQQSTLPFLSTTASHHSASVRVAGAIDDGPIEIGSSSGSDADGDDAVLTIL